MGAFLFDQDTIPILFGHSKKYKILPYTDGTSGHPHGSGQWYWVLEEPIDSAIVTGGPMVTHKTNNSHSGTL